MVKDPVEGNAALLDRLPPPLLAVNQANGADHLEARLARAFDGLDRGAARCADILDNHHLVAVGVGEAFEKLPAAVLLRFLADEEAVDFEAKFEALPRDRRDDGVRAHGESADGNRMPAVLLHLADKKRSR